MEEARGLEFRVEPELGTELLPSPGQTGTAQDVLLRTGKESGVLRWSLFPGKMLGRWWR